MIATLNKLIFGWQEPPPPPKLVQVCDLSKILTAEQAKFIGNRFQHLLKCQRYVVFVKRGRLYLFHKDENGRLHERAWISELPTAQAIKILNSQGYMQTTLDNYHLVPVKSVEERKSA